MLRNDFNDLSMDGGIPWKNGRYTSHHACSRKIFTVIPYHLILNALKTFQSTSAVNVAKWGEIIHVRQIVAKLWSLTLRIFTHFSLSSQLPYPCMDLNETWQKCCTKCGPIIMFFKFWRSHDSWKMCFRILFPLWNKPIAVAHVLQTCFV